MVSPLPYCTIEYICIARMHLVEVMDGSGVYIIVTYSDTDKHNTAKDTYM